MAEIYLNVGPNRVIVNPYSISGNVSRELSGKLDQVIMKTLFKDLPCLDGETRAAYDLRYKAWDEARVEAAKKAKEAKDTEPAAKKGTKKAIVEEEPAAEDDKETLLEYIRRSLELTKYDDQMEYMYNVVKAIAETFNQEKKVNMEALQNEPLIHINNFICDVCKYSRIPIGFTPMKADNY